MKKKLELRRSLEITWSNAHPLPDLGGEIIGEERQEVQSVSHFITGLHRPTLQSSFSSDKEILNANVQHVSLTL